MTASKRMRRALVSVYHKEGLDEIIKKLHEEGVSFVSTGGTQTFIESLGIPCEAVEELTGYPSILGGRVKTLHPNVFGEHNLRDSIMSAVFYRLFVVCRRAGRQPDDRAGCFRKTCSGTQRPPLGNVYLLVVQHVFRSRMDGRRCETNGLRQSLSGKESRYRPVGKNRQRSRNGLHPVPDKTSRRFLSLGHKDDGAQSHQCSLRQGRTAGAEDVVRQVRRQTTRALFHCYGALPSAWS